MSKMNAEKFCALYEQHKAIAKHMAALDIKSEESLLAGLVKMAKELGLDCTKDELKGVAGDLKKAAPSALERVAGGANASAKDVSICPSCGQDELRRGVGVR